MPPSLRGLYLSSAWDDLKARRRLPVRQVLHLVLLGLSAAIVKISSLQWAQYMLGANRNWCYWFYPEGCYPDQCGKSGGDGGLGKTCYVYDRNATIAAVKRTVDNYYGDLTTQSIACYEHVTTADGSQVKPIELTAIVRKTSDAHSVETLRADLGPGDLGPFAAGSGLDSFFDRLVMFELRLEVSDAFADSVHEGCFIWDVTMHYEMRQASQFRVWAMSNVGADCGHKASGEAAPNWSEAYRWLCAAAAAVAALHLLSTLWALWERRKAYVAAKRAVMDAWAAHDADALASSSRGLLPRPPRVPRWEDLPLAARLRFVEGWLLVELAGCAFLLGGIASALRNFPEPLGEGAGRIAFAAGLGVSWAALLGHLRRSGAAGYAVLATVREATPRVVACLLGAMPFFMGFLAMGIVCFGDRIPRFGDLGQAGATLFSILNGDAIYETLKVQESRYGWAAAVYTVAYYFFFVYIMLNVVLVIVEASLWAASRRGRGAASAQHAGGGAGGAGGGGAGLGGGGAGAGTLNGLTLDLVGILDREEERTEALRGALDGFSDNEVEELTELVGERPPPVDPAEGGAGRRPPREEPPVPERRAEWGLRRRSRG